MTTTQITTIQTPLVDPAYYGDFADDYRTEEIEAEVLAALNAAARAEIGDGVTIAADGTVYADVEIAGAARDLDFTDLLGQVDVNEIAQRWER